MNNIPRFTVQPAPVAAACTDPRIPPREQVVARDLLDR